MDIKKPLVLLHFAGPGDIGGTFDYWLQGLDDPMQTHCTFSGQFYDVCRDLGARGYAISCNESPYAKTAANITVQHVPKAKINGGGLMYHVREFLYGLRIIWKSIQVGADYTIVDGGMTHWIALLPLVLLRKKVITSQYCAVYSKGEVFTPIKRFFLNVNCWFMKRCAYGVIVSADSISQQIADIIHEPIDAKLFLPLYRRSQFAGMQLISQARVPTRILFVGRIVFNKGIFDLLTIAQLLLQKGHKAFVIDVCGTGSELENLKKAVEVEGLSDYIKLHGHCKQAAIKEKYDAADIVIMPTHADFAEGFTQVVAEAILAGRPVVTSRVFAGLDYLRDAIIEVEPNDVEAYANAIEHLMTDAALYQQKAQAAIKLQEAFFDENKSWKGTLKAMIAESV